ncbi:MAG: hypothetical protein KAZ11_02935 [Chitinophagaceae bacterium]|nr:hypothetical protein [Chitinophagaceae bacterium]
MKKLLVLLSFMSFLACQQKEKDFTPSFKLIPSEKFVFKSFVDCNMAEAWIGDTFRIFPGKYGEDPVWGYSNELEFASGKNADEVFLTPHDQFTDPIMPPNTPPGTPGLHGAVWFETVYQSQEDKSGKTLYAVYHNENYPETLPYDPKTGEGYIDTLWPEGLTGPQSVAAVCRIGVMKSTNGGHSWENKGLFIEDLQPRMVLKPHNNSLTFAGGVGDPSAVASGEYLYLFYGEYGYPGVYDEKNYDSVFEASGHCISVARIKIKDLDNPQGKALRWDGKAFAAAYNGIGKPIPSLQILKEDKGGGASRAGGNFHWGPSVSWNEYLNCWVMMMGRVEGKKWVGDKIYISFNKNKDLGAADHSQQWSKPQLVLQKPGHILWYPSLQPMNTEEDVKAKRTCLRLGKKARLFVKYMEADNHQFISEYIIDFEKLQ